MGNVYADSKRTGKSYLVSVAGDTPTPQELADIERYVDAVEGFGAPVVAEQPTDELGSVGDLIQGTASGLARSLADVPGGLASLTAAGLRKYVPGDQGEDSIEEFGQGATDALRTGIDYTIGTPEDNIMGKGGQAIGSIGSYFLGGTGAVKAASALGKGAKAQRIAGTATAAVMGSAQGAQNQVDRIARFVEQGGELTSRDAAILTGGLIGTSEAIPISRAFGVIANMLKKVPKEAKKEAVKTVMGRLKSAGKVGLAEGAQEVTAAILQDLTEKGMYNPSLEITQSAYHDDAIYGGGAGATFNFLLETLAGRRVNKVIKRQAQLIHDQREEGEEVKEQVDRAKGSLNVKEPTEDDSGDVLLIAGPAAELSAEDARAAEVELEQPTETQREYNENLKNLGLNQDQEQTAIIESQAEFRRGEENIEITELSDGEQAALRQSRQRAGVQDVDGPTTLEEIRNVLGRETYNRIGRRKKPRTFQDELSAEEIARREEDIRVQEAVNKNKVAAQTLIESPNGEVLNKDGNVSRSKIQRMLGITAVEAQALIDEMTKIGVVEAVSRTAVKPVNPPTPPTEQQEAERSEEAVIDDLSIIRSRQQVKIDEAKKLGIGSQQEQLQLEEDQRVLDELDAQIESRNKRLEEIRRSAPPNPSSAQVRNNQALVVQQEAEESQPTEEYKRKINTVANALRKYLFGLGLSDVDLVTQNVIDYTDTRDPTTGVGDISIVEGTESQGENSRRVITLAMEIYDPNLSEAELEQRLASVLNHEIIHAMRGLGLFTDAEFAMLVKAAEKRKYVKRSGGRNVEREYTFLDRAEHMYPDESAEVQQEEAVAEMFRAYAEGRIKVGGKPKGLFARMVKFIKGIFQGHSDAGFNSAAEIFDQIKSGKVGRRQRNLQAASIAPAGAKYSTAGVRAGFLIPERGNVERIQQSFKDVTKRIDAMTQAANKLLAGEIDYLAYDKLVNDVKPIIPYETVPAPASLEDMRRGLNVSQVEKINNIRLIPEGTEVLLRLDIPAYRDNGVWVPTIHGTKETVPLGFKPQEVISHESVSIVNNAVLSMTEGQQKGGLKIAAGINPKSPYATIKGKVEYTSPDAAFAEAQMVLNDPNYSQVGFDPFRHSYFYDRVTTQPIIAADRIIQVGPLVLAKNPVFANKSEFKYSVRTIRNMPTNLIGPIPIVHDVKAQYMNSIGLPNRRQGEYVQVDVPLATRIAQAFEEAEDRSSDPDVQIAYQAMANETMAQWQFIKGTGLDVEFIKEDMDNPYPNGSRDVLIDIRDNNHMWVFPTDTGFGQASITAEDEAANPLLARANETVDGIDMRINDVFRIVHDYFGHGLEGATFTARGEENAWQSHVRMYSPVAARAMTTETRGQNSWVNFGPVGEQNRANPADTIYAEQKITLLPDFVVEEGIAPDLESTNEQERINRSIKRSSLSGDARPDVRRVDGVGTGSTDVRGAVPTGQEADFGSPKPTVDENGLTRLVHYSPIQGIDAVSPSEQLTNNRMRGEERQRKALFPKLYQPRSYFGMNVGEANGYNKEATVGDNVYETKVPLDSLYNYDQDPDGFVSKAAASVDENIMERTWGNPKPFIVTTAENSIKDAGYSGYWSNSRMGMVAAMFDDTVVKPVVDVEAKKQSIRRLTTDTRGLSIIDFVDPETGEFDNGYFVRQAPKNKIKIEDAIRSYQEKRGNVVLNIDDEADAEKIATIMAAEAEFALSQDNNAIGWYDTTLKKAKILTASLFPDIATDPDHELAYDFATAITSNGVSVIGNWEFASEQYRNWVKTGKFLEKGYGNQGKSMIKGFKFWNAMKDSGMTEAEIKDFLSQKMTVSELRQNPVLSSLGISVPTSELAAQEIYVSYVLGAKIGNGFFQNLSGNYETLTMDRWWMRMFNRISGNPFKKLQPTTVPRNMARFIAATNMPLTNFENSMLEDAKNAADVDAITEANALSVAIELDKLFQADFNRAKTADLRPDKTELFLASERYKINALGELQEDPRNASDRAAMRRITNRAIDILREDTGQDISMADFQALMWFPEKKFLYSLGVPKGQGDNNDYIDGAIALLRKEGKSDNEIKETLVEADRVIGSGQSSAGRIDEEVRDDIEESDLSETSEDKTKYSKRSVRYVPLTIEGTQPLVSNEQMLRAAEQSYERTTYNNVGRVLGNLYSKVFDDEKAKRWEAKTERFITKFQDSMLPVGKLMDELRSDGLTIPDAMDVYMREELAQGVMGYQLDENKEKLYEPLTDTIKQIDISQAKVDELAGISNFFDDARQAYDPKLAIADAYVYALHAKERNAYVEARNGVGLGSGMSNQEADRILNWVESLDIASKSTLNGIKDTVVQIVKNTNDVRREGGLMAEEYNFSNYVPLRGILDPEEDLSEDLDSVPRIGRKKRNNLYGGVAYQDPQITTGRGTNYAEDIIANVMVQNSKSIVAAERNKVGQSFLKLIDPKIFDPEAEYVMSKQNRDGIAIIVDKVTPDIQENVLKVKINGRQEPINVLIRDNRVARAMRGAGGDGIERGGAIVRSMTKFNRYLSNINTTWNPEFAITNFFRDLETAGVNINQYDQEGISKEVMKNAPFAVKGILASTREGGFEGFDKTNWTDIYNDFRENGGKNSTNQVDSVKDQMERIKSVLDEVSNNSIKGKLGLSRNGFINKIGGFIDAYNTAIENGVRIATYHALLKRGYSKDRAAQAARNVTVNFAKQGEEKALMNALYLFYNASLQGSMALFNAGIRSSKVRKIWGGMIVTGVLLDQFASAFSGDEDEDGISDYDELGEYTLEHNLIFPTFGLLDDKFIKIPLGYGINTALNLGRSMSRVQRGEYTPAEAFNSTFGTLAESLNPLGDTNWENAIVPTVADPFVSLAVNKDFKGDPIVKEASPFGVQKPDSQLYWSNTSALYKNIASVINTFSGGTEITPGMVDISPETIDYWAQYFTGAAGAFALRTAESPSKVIESFKDDLDGDIIREIPFARKLFTAPSSREDTGQYIENRDRILRAGKELQFSLQSGDVGREQKIRRQYDKELSIYGQLKAMNNFRNKLVRNKNKVQSSQTIPEEQKKAIIRRLREKIQEVEKRAAKVVRDAGIR